MPETWCTQDQRHGHGVRTWLDIDLYRANGRGRSGGQTAGGDPKASRLKQPLFAVPALRELESACRVSVL